MSWVNPWMLFGLAGIAVPVLIHLARREAQQGRVFPSLMFMRQIRYKTRERKTLRNPWLLSARCALLALLVLALAGPYFIEQPNESKTLQSGRDVVLAMDRSFSMEYGNRWAQAVEAAKQQIKELKTEDRASLVLFDQFAELAVPLTSDHASITAALNNAQPGDGSTRYGPALRRVESLLSDSRAASRELIVIGDLQPGSDRGLRLRDDVGIIAIPVSSAEGSNLSLMSALVQDSPVSDTRKSIEVRVRNTGSQSASNKLGFVVNDRTLGEQTVALEPGEETRIDFELLVSEDRASSVVFQMNADEVEADNALHLIISSAPRIRSLLIYSAESASSSSIFVEQALRLSKQPKVDITRKTFDELDDDVPFADFELVVLFNASLPAGDQADALARFVKTGGALMLIGIGKAPQQWPSPLAEILPGSGAGNSIEVGARGIKVTELDHPVTTAFAGDSGSALEDVRVFRRKPLIEKSGDTVLARLDDQSPFLVVRESGSGRVLLFVAAPGMPESNLGMNPGFAPLLIESLRYLAREPTPAVASMVGNPIDLQANLSGLAGGSAVLAALNRGQNIEVESPDGKLHQISKSGIYLPDQSGVHQLHAGAAASLPIAVNIDPAETQFASTDIETWLASIARVPARSNAEFTLSNDEPPPSNLWWYLLALALIAGVIELLLGNVTDRRRQTHSGFAGA